MNEVGFTPLHGPQSLRTDASSKVAPVADHQKSGEPLPLETKKATGVSDPAVTEKTPSAEPQALEDMVASVNDYVQSIERDLHFSVDEELETTVIKVVDSTSGDVIRQIPEDVFLDLARNLKEDGELRLVNALG